MCPSHGSLRVLGFAAAIREAVLSAPDGCNQQVVSFRGELVLLLTTFRARSGSRTRALVAGCRVRAVGSAWAYGNSRAWSFWGSARRTTWGPLRPDRTRTCCPPPRPSRTSLPCLYSQPRRAYRHRAAARPL